MTDISKPDTALDGTPIWPDKGTPAETPQYTLTFGVEPQATTPTDPIFGYHHDDINAPDAWTLVTGEGVQLAIIDDGFDYVHPDLDGNYRTDLDFDFLGNDADAAPGGGDQHGTWVAGVAASEADGAGTVGVAFDADIVGVRIGFGAQGDLGQLEDAFGYAVANADIVNGSFGFDTPFADNFRSTVFGALAQELEDGAATGRGGLGTVFVISAGNERGDGDNANYHNLQNSPYTIAVGAVNSSGNVTNFSNPGAALLVTAPGASIPTTHDTGSYANVSGTSFSAPIVSGVVALMLEANPDLGYRDVQEILALTAQRNDPGDAGWATNGAQTLNGGGLHFNHDYGFGLVDAAAAVRLAETWQAQSVFPVAAGPQVVTLDAAAIPDNTASGISQTVTIDAAWDIDTVQVVIDIVHEHVGDLVLTLTSPDGTEATLVDRPSNGTNDDQGLFFTFTANNFWGESGLGDWTLSVSDEGTGGTGSLLGWALVLNGDAPSDDTTHVLTNEFAGAELSDLAGHDILNAAAVSTAVTIDLSSGATGQVAGASLTFAAGTTIEEVYTGDGNDAVTGDGAANLLWSGRGNDIVAGGDGNDTLIGHGGNDMVDGGDGDDVARLFADLGDYIVTITGTTSLTIDDVGTDALDEGFDSYDFVEWFQFADALYGFSDLVDLFGEVDPPTGLAPDQIAGLNLWLDASDAATLIDSDGDGLVNIWTDKAGNHDASASGDREPGTVAGGVAFDGVSDGLAIADAADLNTGALSLGKTLTLVFTSGGDIASRQVLYEQGGGVRGLNLYVEDGQVHVSGWNLNEEAWGPATVSGDIVTDTTYVVSLHFDAAAGTLSGNLNGTSMGSVGGVTGLYQHTGDIGLGFSNAGSYFDDGPTSSSGAEFGGVLHEVAFHDRALTDSELGDLHLFLGDKWLGPVEPPVNQPPVAVDDNASTTVDNAVIVDVLANDSDDNGDPLTVTAVGTAANGAVLDNGDGTVTYTPNIGFVGDDSFTYTIDDGQGGADTATVFVTVSPPSAGAAPDEIAGLNLWLDAADAATLIDSDGDGLINTWTDKAGNHDATASGSREPDSVIGGVVFDGASDGLAIADAADLNAGSLSFGKTLTLVFTSGGDTASRQVLYEQGGGVRGLNLYVEGGQVHVSGWNLAEESWGPATVSGDIATDTTYVVSLRFDGTAGTLSGSLNGVSMGSVGGVSGLYQHSGDIGLGFANDGSYFPDGATSNDGLEFGGILHEAAFYDRALNDGELSDLHQYLGDKWTAPIEPPAGQPPTAVDDNASTVVDNAVVVDVLANDSDANGDPLTVTAVGTATNGAVVDNGDGTVTYTPNIGFVGDDSFTYTIDDGVDGTAQATVFVSVTEPPAGLAPDQIAGLDLWLDANDATSLVDSDSDGQLNSWLDKSGFGHDATASGATQPGIAGGIVFDGAVDVLGVDDSAQLNVGGPYDGKTVSVTFTTGTDIASRQVLWEQGGSVRGLNLHIEDGEVRLGAWNLNETDWGPLFVNSALTTNTSYIATLVFDGVAGTVSGTLNGGSIGSLSGASLLHDHSGDIGAGATRDSSYFASGADGTSGPNHFFEGTLLEIVAFDHALDVADRQGLETYLTDKWGIDDTLIA